MQKNQQTSPKPINKLKSTSGIKRIFLAFHYSCEGLKTAWKNEHAFRQELMIIAPACVIALFLPVPALQKLLLITALLWILIIELINSAIEAVIDRISLENHPLSKNAKDFGSAAVGLTILLAVITWLVILCSFFIAA